MKTKFSQGSTLIELLVVITIVMMLYTTVLTSLNKSREKGKVTRAKIDMKQLNIAMQMYLNDNLELPPIGDNCSGCVNPCSSTDWASVVDALMSGGQLSIPIDKDPWGNPYCYDDNYRVFNCDFDSVLWSMGPNGARDTSWRNGPPTTFVGDDIGMIIEAPQC